MPRLKQNDILLQDSFLIATIKWSAGYFGLIPDEQASIAGVKRATWYRRLKTPSDFTVGEIRRMVSYYGWTVNKVGKFLGAKESSPWDI